MLTALLCALLCSHVALADDACGLARSNEPALRAIAAAATAEQLETARRAWVRDDAIVRLFFASRLAAVSPGVAADNALIHALPTREQDVALMYTFTYGCAAPESIVRFGGGAWIEQARDAVIRQRSGVRAFLMLSWLYRSNADIGASLPDDTDAVRRALPRQYSRALRSLPADVRALVLGGRELLPRQ